MPKEKQTDQRAKEKNQTKIIRREKVEEFRLQIIQQLQEAREKKLYWIKKEIGLEASLAACDHILKLPGTRARKE